MPWRWLCFSRALPAPEHAPNGAALARQVSTLAQCPQWLVWHPGSPKSGNYRGTVVLSVAGSQTQDSLAGASKYVHCKGCLWPQLDLLSLSQTENCCTIEQRKVTSSCGEFQKVWFSSTSELKKNFGKKDSFWNHESNFPLSSNKQIVPKEGRETLQEKEGTKKKKWGKSNKWGFLQSPVTMRQLHPGIHDSSWRIAPETASIWQDRSWTQCTGFPGGASIGSAFLWKESMASLHPWGSPSQWTSTRLPLLLHVAKAWGSFSPPWENEVGRCEGSLPKSGRRAIPPFTTPSSSDDPGPPACLRQPAPSLDRLVSPESPSWQMAWIQALSVNQDV